MTIAFVKDQPGFLHESTLALLRSRSPRLKFAHIAEDTNLEAAWIAAFAKGKISHPSGSRLEVLHAYLLTHK